MSNAKLKLMIAVFSRRINQGETFGEIVEDYPKLTAEDLEKVEYGMELEEKHQIVLDSIIK